MSSTTDFFPTTKTSNIAKVAVPNCPACDSTQRKHLYDVREHEYSNTTDDVFPLHECLGCAAWYLDPRPAESALGIIYPPNYYAYVLDVTKPDDIQKSREGLVNRIAKKFQKKRLKPLEKYTTLDSNTRWLDIGCSNGNVLEWLKDVYGFSGVGLDLSERAVNFCRERGFQAYVSRFEEFQLPPGEEKFDVVLSSHVIEHVASPKEYMEKAYELLKPGGLCVFITPNIDTWEARLFGKHWGGLHVPRHWTMLDEKSSRSLGERSGFEFLEAAYSNNPTFWVWTFHSMLEPILGRNFVDFFLPSDHRFVNNRLTTVGRLGFFTFWDIANTIFTGKSANMMCIFRKPLK
ncbi:MAG: class I SAM-dependent methyltransferase [Candidatus Melainabacteria bacterium]|nr:class I SAM-dependent methyltransferase [Candidatus Melainabacteria bacterium]